MSGRGKRERERERERGRDVGLLDLGPDQACLCGRVTEVAVRSEEEEVGGSEGRAGCFQQRRRTVCVGIGREEGTVWFSGNPAFFRSCGGEIGKGSGNVGG
ncbi:unnamed protein product [Boreogadus saida]